MPAREIEVLAPSRDPAVAKLEDSGDRQLEPAVGAAREDIDALVEDEIATGGAVENANLDRVRRIEERREQRAQFREPARRSHRDVVADDVVGEEARQLVEVAPRPGCHKAVDDCLRFGVHRPSPVSSARAAADRSVRKCGSTCRPIRLSDLRMLALGIRPACLKQITWSIPPSRKVSSFRITSSGVPTTTI